MRLVVSGRAARRLREIGAHIRRESPAGALRVERGLREAFGTLAAQPNLGRAFNGQVRRYVVPRLPYLIFYRADENAGELLVITIRHARQRPLSS